MLGQAARVRMGQAGDDHVVAATVGRQEAHRVVATEAETGFVEAAAVEGEPTRQRSSEPAVVAALTVVISYRFMAATGQSDRRC